MMKITNCKLLAGTTALFCIVTLTGCTKEVTNKDLSIIMNGEEISGTFTGTLVDNSANGEGEFTASIDNGGWIYAGTFENNEIAGNGLLQNYTYKLTIPNNSFDVTYTGECSDGLPNGNGTVQGEVGGASFAYNGEFSQGNFSGKGSVINYPHILSYENNEISGLYTGELSDGIIVGNGTFADTMDDIDFHYDGEWLNGNMSNSGNLKCDKYVVHFKHTDRIGAFDGETNNGIAEGEGTFETINDANQRYIYTGSWSNGLFNGYGEVHFIDSTDDILDEIGTFTDGDYTPTPSEFIVRLSGGDNAQFEVSYTTTEFIKNNEIYFGEDAVTDYPSDLIQNIDYKEYAKRSYAYPELFIEADCIVENIWEYNARTTVSNTITEIYGNLPNDSFADFDIFYFDSLPDVYSGAKLKITGIPVAYGSVKNTLGGKNACMFLLAFKIEVY